MATYPVRLPIDDLSAHLPTLKAELQEGHTVELVSGNDVVGEVRAPAGTAHPEAAHSLAPQRSPRPDFMARLKEMWGDKPLDVDTTAWVREDRDGYDDVP